MPIRLNSTGGGAVTITAPYTASTYTLTAPTVTANLVTDSANSITQSMMSTGLAGTGPAFSAYLSSNQSPSGSTYTKIQFDTEEFDTDSCFNTSTYKFTPTVAGYYQVNATIGFDATSVNPQWGGVAIYKNGAVVRQNRVTGNTYTSCAAPVSSVVYLNGSTDYLEIFAITNGGTGVFVSSSGQWSNFSAALVRAA